MNDVLIRKQARFVKTNEYLILRGEPDWLNTLLFGAFKVDEIKHHSEDTVTFRLRAETACVRKVLPDSDVAPYNEGWHLITQPGWVTVGRSQIVTRYSGRQPPPLWILTESP